MKSVIIKSKNILIMSALCICLMLFNCNQVLADKIVTEKGEVSNNVGSNTYGTYGQIVKSYLYENEKDGLTRVEYVNGKILVEEYDKDFNLLNTKTIDMELETFGGFYSGKNANYLFFGQSNKEENDKVEVYRVVKYSKNWKRIDSCGLFGANTVNPFSGGSLRADEKDNMLYVRTCHSMYKTDDGYNHQANVTFSVDTDTMKIKDSVYEVTSIWKGYVSHSFNQFIKVDGDDLIGVDHGDAYPRSMVLVKYNNALNIEEFSNSSIENVNLTTFTGNTGDNYTNANLGGLEVSDNSYLVVGNKGDSKTKGIKNVFLSITSKDKNLSEEDVTEFKMLTSYTKDDNKQVSNAQLVKIDNDLFVVLWEVTDKNNKVEVNYVFIDGNGELKTDIKILDYRLSNCQPIVYNNKIVWYSTQETSPVFHTLNININDDMTKSEKIYCLDKNGKIVTKTLKVVGEYIYYFDKNGNVLKETLKTINGENYYFDENGKALTEAIKTINNKKYYFDKDGKMIKNQIINYEDNIYYFNKNGKALTKTLKVIGENLYYFDKNGKAIKDTSKTINGAKYTFDKNGKAKITSKIKTINNEKYYFDENGKIVQNKLLSYEGNTYYFNENGKAVTNKLMKFNIFDYMFFGYDIESMSFDDFEIIYYFDKSGKAIKNTLKTINGAKYYFDENGKMVTSKTLTINGKKYIFDENGVGKLKK